MLISQRHPHVFVAEKLCNRVNVRPAIRIQLAAVWRRSGKAKVLDLDVTTGPSKGTGHIVRSHILKELVERFAS